MYDPDLLRTFLTVAEALSFTSAGRQLGLSQPTVSQQVRRLEGQVGRTLLIRDTRTVVLTADGEALVAFARDILAAHERAVGHFTGSTLTGRLRFGVTDDLALSSLPRILRGFRHLYPRIDLELTVRQNETLLSRIESGHLDVAFVKRWGGASLANRGQLVRRDQWVWAGAEGLSTLPDPVPLVAYPPSSPSRSMSVDALDAAGIRSSITCVVRAVNGALAAIRAGLGIAVFARSLLPSDLVELPTSIGLPALPVLDLVLLTNPGAPEQSASALTSAILSSGAPLMPGSLP